MKTIICHCVQCRYRRKITRKKNRIQTYQVRAARHKVKRLLQSGEYEDLPEKVSVDYYA